MTLARPFAPPSVADQPFRPAIECVVDLPCPPSVNKVRRKHGPGTRARKAWEHQADMHIMANGGARRLPKMPARFEALLILDEATVEYDLDNPLKSAIDYAKRIGLIVDDDKRYMRRVVLEWGSVPSGARLILRSVA